MSAYSFTCKPTRLDAAPSNTRYHQFRTSYNAWLDARDPSDEPDLRGPGKLSQWGRLDKSIWGAVFDLYQHNLREELGEDTAGVNKLRGLLKWLDDSDRALGFSEHHPVDKVGRDNYRSQANRRVEVLFFDEGEEPALEILKEAPDITELYLPSAYARKPLEPMVSAKRWRAHWDPCDGPAKMEQERVMILDAPGLVPGVPAKVTVLQHSEESGQTTRVIEVNSGDGNVTATFDGWYEPDFVKAVSGGKLPQVAFRFEVVVGGRAQTSGKLLYSDSIDAQFTDSETDAIIAGIPYKLVSPWGSLEGTTGEDGSIVATELPPGGVTVVLQDYRLETT